ncbi:MAG: hypothetical protein QOG54_2585 [Actinomycetota bacterium]|jgi:hypothetical protein|nr:hypothetical protein [Actinomycetota bacterium]
MDPNRLTTGEKVLGVSGLLLFILSFLKLWAKIEVNSEGLGDLGGLGNATQKFSAWDAYGFLVKLGLICALIAVILVIARAAMANLSLPVPLGLVYLGLAGVTLVFTLLALAVGPDESGSGTFFGVSVEISRGIGLFIGAILAIVMAAGAWLHYQSEGTGTPVVGSTLPPTQPPPPTAP